MGSKADLLQFAVATAMGGGGLLVKALKNHKRVRKVADTPRSKVASAPQGFVELEGFAWPQGETFLTLDNEEAVYYSVELQREETTGSGKNRRRKWVTVFHHEHVTPFYILDPTGVAIIIPHNSDLDVTNVAQKRFSQLSATAKARMSELVGPMAGDLPLADGFFSKISASKYQVLEKKVIVGSPFYASGDFKTHSQNQLTIDDSLVTFANKVIDFEARTFKNVKNLLDLNKDGIVCSKEALAGYSTAAKLSRLNPQKESAPLQVFGVLESSENHKLFFSDTHEHHLIEHLKRFQTLKLAGGAALITASLCAGLLEFGLISNPFEAAKAERQKQIAYEQQAQVETQKQITALHEACASGQAGFCRQLIDRKDELHLSQQHIKYYETMGCRSGELTLCRQPASN